MCVYIYVGCVRDHIFSSHYREDKGHIFQTLRSFWYVSHNILPAWNVQIFMEFLRSVALTSEDINNFFKQPIELSRFFLKFSLNFASTRVPSVIVSMRHLYFLY